MLAYLVLPKTTRTTRPARKGHEQNQHRTEATQKKESCDTPCPMSPQAHSSSLPPTHSLAFDHSSDGAQGEVAWGNWLFGALQVINLGEKGQALWRRKGGWRQKGDQKG